jgi:serine/threonine-protein kinase HipA
MYRPVDAVEIHVWGRKVGAVALDKNLRYYVFEYEPKFIRTGIELAPLALPLAKARSPFVFMDLPELTYKRLPALLADALPDDFGNTLIDGWMARQGLTSIAITALDRLAYMGKRGMGALEFRPARGPTAKTCTALSMSALVENARRAVHGELTFEHSTHAALAQIIKVGTSAGGARAKAVVAWNAKTQEIRTGQFDVDPGFEHWLLKFDGMGKDRELGGSQDYGRIEYAYSKMATAAGITVSPCTLLTENGRAHFMTKRFDTICKHSAQWPIWITSKRQVTTTISFFKPLIVCDWSIRRKKKLFAAWPSTSWQPIATTTRKISPSYSARAMNGGLHPHMM